MEKENREHKGRGVDLRQNFILSIYGFLLNREVIDSANK